MAPKTPIPLTLALVASSLFLPVGCGKKSNSSDPNDVGSSEEKPNPKTVAKAGTDGIPITISTLRIQLALTGAAPSTVSAYPLKIASDKTIAPAGAAAATGKVDAKGKAALKLPPGYYEVISKMADGTEHRSSVIHVVNTGAAKLHLADSNRPLVTQLDNDTKIARLLAKQVILHDPDLFTKSGLNLGLIFKQAQNLADASHKKKKNLTPKDVTSTAKVIASETQKNARSLNAKAAAKKTALFLDESQDLDAYGQVMAALDAQVMSPDLAAKFTMDDVDPRKLYGDAEAALTKSGAIDSDVLNEAQTLDSEDVAKALGELTGDDVPDILRDMIQEIALDAFLDHLEDQASIADLTPEQFATLMAAVTIEFLSMSPSDLDAIFTELADSDVDANTSNPLLQILAKVEDHASPTAILSEVNDVSTNFDASEQALLATYTDEVKADQADERAAAADAAEEIKEIDSSAAQADDSLPEE